MNCSLPRICTLTKGFSFTRKWHEKCDRFAWLYGPERWFWEWESRIEIVGLHSFKNRRYLLLQGVWR